MPAWATNMVALPVAVSFHASHSRVNMGSASILLALAGMVPARFGTRVYRELKQTPENFGGRQ